MEIKIYIWREVVRINMSGNATALEKVMQHVTQRWSEFNQSVYHVSIDSKFLL